MHRAQPSVHDVSDRVFRYPLVVCSLILALDPDYAPCAVGPSFIAFQPCLNTLFQRERCVTDLFQVCFSHASEVCLFHPTEVRLSRAFEACVSYAREVFISHVLEVCQNVSPMLLRCVSHAF